MSDQAQPSRAQQSAPKMTALSTAYPMHFDSRDHCDETPSQAPQQAPREPHRHDAGE